MGQATAALRPPDSLDRFSPWEAEALKTRKLGLDGPSISAVGLGCMVMSGDYGPAAEHDSIATMHRALDIGVNFLDTADIYGLGGNETHLTKTLSGCIQTKESTSSLILLSQKA